MPLQLPRRPAKTSRRAPCSALAGGSIPTLDQSASAMLPARSSPTESAAWTASGGEEQSENSNEHLARAGAHGGSSSCAARVGSPESRKRSACRRKSGKRQKGPRNSECPGQLEREVSG